MTGTLYLVPTPIGNLGDISPRCVEALRTADFIAAEDTRVSLKLLNHLGLKKPLTAYHRHNAERVSGTITGRILAGESCALVTDAGTPAISDPGEELVASCAALDIPVISLPGPCALITALAVSGLPTGRFIFEGFLPQNKKNRRAQLAALRDEARTMLFYEAPHKLQNTLCDLRDTFGGTRRVTLCRELTKLHEEVWRTTLDEAAAHYREEANTPRGEFVLVVEGGCPQQKDSGTIEEGAARVEELCEMGASLRDAVREAAQELELSRNELYDFMLNLRK